MLVFFLVPVAFSCNAVLLCPDGSLVWCETFGECGEQPSEHDCGTGPNHVWCKCLGMTVKHYCPFEN